jgi:hypothetical protein
MDVPEGKGAKTVVIQMGLRHSIHVPDPPFGPIGRGLRRVYFRQDEAGDAPGRHRKIPEHAKR